MINPYLIHAFWLPPNILVIGIVRMATTIPEPYAPTAQNTPMLSRSLWLFVLTTINADIGVPISVPQTADKRIFVTHA